EGLQILLEGCALRRRRRDRDGVDVANPLLLATDETFGFETRQHHPDRGIAGWRVKTAADGLHRGTVVEREQRVDNFPLPAGQTINVVFGHRPRAFAAGLRDTCREAYPRH